MDRKIKVLVVDDEVDFSMPMSFWLKAKGYDVASAVNGQEAIQHVKNSPPDIMFLDLRMPVMDGAATLKKIREFNKTLPVIIISAYVDDRMVPEVMRQGISGIFYKGKDFEESLALLESALKAHKQLKHPSE